MTEPGLATVAKNVLSRLNDDSIESIISDELHQGKLSCSENYETVFKEIEGMGPLDPLLSDPNVSEIMINGPFEIFFEKAGVLSNAQTTFLTEQTYNRCMERLISEAAKSIDERFPMADGKLRSGARIHFMTRPVTKNTVATIRKHTSHLKTLDELEQQGMLSVQQRKILDKWTKERKNFLICGSTGSGKTTLLRALLNTLPVGERLLILEDTEEIQLGRPNAVSLLTRVDPQGLAPDISLDILLKNSLRMRPDRIIIGEIRGIEALTLLDSLSTGHRGSICSLHAQSALQGCQRLESLISRGAPQWTVENIRRMILESISGLVMVCRENNERVVRQLVEIKGLESFGFLFETVG